MKVGILDSQRAHLPEINAYINYFQANDIEARRIYKDELDDISKFDLIWKFPGMDIKRENKEIYLVHEYNSMTIGRFGAAKDFLKKNLNVSPDGRVFLNSDLREKYNFKDNVPSVIRDMGVANEFYMEELVKEYDFVYIGAMDENRRLDELLHNFKDVGYTILMIGTPNDKLFNEFKVYKNITFTGKVPYAEVPKLASKAVYGVNYIPNVRPYNEQTSTKLLEYCALNLKVITTNYAWVRDFEMRHNASFYKIKGNDEKINFNDIFNFNYIMPAMEEYKWENVLDNSKILDFLYSIT